MYHDEKIINGILYWRGTPNGEWTQYTLTQLTAKIERLRRQVQRSLESLSEDIK
jgi:hypothetical protein